MKGVNILSLGEKNSKIFSESERIRICIENSGETLQVQMTVEFVAVVIHRRTRHLNYQNRAVVNFKRDSSRLQGLLQMVCLLGTARILRRLLDLKT